MNKKCSTCPRVQKDFLLFPFGNSSQYSLCGYCNNKNHRGFIFNKKKMTFDPPPGLPVKKRGPYKKKERKTFFGMSKEEKENYHKKFGKHKFNTAIVESRVGKIGKKVKKAIQNKDTWYGWDDYDFKEENYHLHLL